MLGFKFCMLLLFLALFSLSDAAPRRKSFEKRDKIRQKPKNEVSYVKEDIAPRDSTDRASNSYAIITSDSSTAETKPASGVAVTTSASADCVASSDIAASSTAASTVSSNDVASSTATSIASTLESSGDDGTASTNIKVFKKGLLCKKWNQDLAAGAAGISSDSSSFAESIAASSVAITTSASADSVASSDVGASSTAASTVSSSDAASSTAVNIASTSGATSSGDDGTASTNIEVFKNWSQDLVGGTAGISSDCPSIAENIDASRAAVTTSASADSVALSDIGASSTASSTVSSSDIASSTASKTALTSGAESSGDDGTASTNIEVFKNWSQDLVAGAAGISSDSPSIAENIDASRVAVTTSASADSVALSDIGASSTAGSTVSSSDIASSTASNTALTSGADSSGDDGTALTNIEVFKKSFLYKKWNQDLAAGSAGISYDSSSIAESIAAPSVEVTTSAGADSVASSDVSPSSTAGSTVSSSDIASSTTANTASTSDAASSGDDGAASKNIEVLKKWSQDLAAGAADISPDSSLISESIEASKVAVTISASADSVASSDIGASSTAGSSVSKSDIGSSTAANTASTSGAASSGDDGTASKNIEVFKKWNQNLAAGAAGISSNYSSIAQSIAASTTCASSDSVALSDVGASSTAGSIVSSSDYLEKCFANIFGILFGLFVNTVKNGITVVTNELTGILDRIPTGTVNIS